MSQGLTRETQLWLSKPLPLPFDGWWGMKTIRWGSEERAKWIGEVCHRLGLLTTDMIDQAVDLGPYRQHLRELDRSEPRADHGFRDSVMMAIVLDVEHAEQRLADPARSDDVEEIRRRIHFHITGPVEAPAPPDVGDTEDAELRRDKSILRWVNGEKVSASDMLRIQALRDAGCRCHVPLLGQGRCRVCNTRLPDMGDTEA